MPQERIDKLIASQGALSRSDVRRLVKSGAIASMAAPCGMPGKKRSRSGSNHCFRPASFYFQISLSHAR